MARRRTVDEAGVVTEGTEINAGESWETGVLVLSWEDVMMGCSHPGDGYNVVLHEFAHQLDAEEGLTDGVPPLRSREEYLDWIRVFQMEYDRLCRETAHGVETLIDPYGTESPAEFFAVATESFFEQAREMEAEHPELYRALQLFFRQDPARFEGSST
jgi:Mlc titration factor MtfA (ptsG expression regulator)